MFLNRHLLEVGLAAAAAVSVSAVATAPAQAQLPAAGLTPNEFASDLGFGSLKTMNLLEPSATLEELKRLTTGESKAQTQAFLSNYQLDASKLFWNGVDPVEVYFINEGAAYRNQLSYSAYDDMGNLKQSAMIFNDISSPDSILSERNGALALGQGVSLGGFVGATQLDFSIISDGFNLAKPGPKAKAKDIAKYESELAKRTLGTDPTKNSDGLQHVVAFQHNDWIILGFEDIVGGGDLDYNDVIFAVRGIQEGAPSEDVPEPSALLGMLVLGIGGFTTLRRRKMATD
ncbi:DUF4114 domain-containing protein [Nodosilinea nodulosa]|uniref:DUF4114 domain-containing protein n=1 Tax=Nodosilinea nodulosa TaxID=416001 RepID=UPI0002D55DFB|nr:DUF4114 domain-containing protein [Nodosilinea nodulosa]